MAEPREPQDRGRAGPPAGAAAARQDGVNRGSGGSRGRCPGGLDENGAVIVVTALSLMVILGIAGLAVDLGYLYLTKCELQRAADAGAMAGARSIFAFPLESATTPVSPRCDAALAKGREIALDNLVDGASPTVDSIQTGNWDWQASLFTPGCVTSPFTNAVSLTARRDGIPLSLMGLLGFGPITLRASSVAVMDFVGKFKQGGAFVMFIGKKYVQQGDLRIYLSPDAVDTGGWYAKPPQSPSSSVISAYLNNPASIPAIQQGDLVNINNGAFTSVVSQLQAAYLGKTVWLPVVDTQKFTQAGPVEGFTAFTITDVRLSGKKYIRGTAQPLRDAPGSLSDPGGAPYGLLSAGRLVK